MAGPRLDERRDVERAADRRRGDPTREVHQVADESPRPRQRKISSFRLVHPCTSRATSQDHGPGRSPVPGRVARCSALRRRTELDRRAEAYRKSLGVGKAKRCENAMRSATCGRAADVGAGRSRPARPVGPASGQGWIPQIGSRMP